MKWLHRVPDKPAKQYVSADGARWLVAMHVAGGLVMAWAMMAHDSARTWYALALCVASFAMAKWWNGEMHRLVNKPRRGDD